MSSSPAAVAAPGPPDSTIRATSAARTVVVTRTSRVSTAWRLATRAIAPRSNATPTTTTAADVMRTRTEPRSALASPGMTLATVSGQPISSAAQRLDGRPPERTVQLVPQAPHVDLDDVRVAVEVEVPDVAQEFPLAEHLAAPAQQDLQQRQLPAGQGQLRVAPPGATRGRIQPQVAGRQYRRPLARPPAQQSPQSSHEYGVREGLRHVVVRAGIQALHLVPLTVLGREHEDWRPGSLRAQDAADPVAVDARQHEVEHDRVEGLFAGEP